MLIDNEEFHMDAHFENYKLAFLKDTKDVAELFVVLDSAEADNKTKGNIVDFLATLHYSYYLESDIFKGKNIYDYLIFSPQSVFYIESDNFSYTEENVITGAKDAIEKENMELVGNNIVSSVVEVLNGSKAVSNTFLEESINIFLKIDLPHDDWEEFLKECSDIIIEENLMLLFKNIPNEEVLKSIVLNNLSTVVNKLKQLA